MQKISKPLTPSRTPALARTQNQRNGAIGKILAARRSVEEEADLIITLLSYYLVHVRIDANGLTLPHSPSISLCLSRIRE